MPTLWGSLLLSPPHCRAAIEWVCGWKQSLLWWEFSPVLANPLYRNITPLPHKAWSLFKFSGLIIQSPWSSFISKPGVLFQFNSGYGTQRKSNQKGPWIHYLMSKWQMLQLGRQASLSPRIVKDEFFDQIVGCLWQCTCYTLSFCNINFKEKTPCFVNVGVGRADQECQNLCISFIKTMYPKMLTFLPSPGSCI